MQAGKCNNIILLQRQYKAIHMFIFTNILKVGATILTVKSAHNLNRDMEVHLRQ